MATVEFECPHCKRVCAFKDRYVGRRARCTHCSTRFLIPAAGQPVQVIKPVRSDNEAFSGFWTALLKDTPKAMVHPHSLAGIGMMIVLSLLRFHIGHPLNAIIIVVILIPFGILTLLPTSLFQCWYLLEIIQSTLEHEDPLPVFVGKGWIERFFTGFINTYMLLMLTAICLAPAWSVQAVMEHLGCEYRWPVWVTAAAGLYVLPLTLTIFAYTRDMLLCLRLGSVLRASAKAFWPHLVMYGLLLATAATLWQADFFARNAASGTLPRSAVFHVIATVLALLTMRTAGLFYRHYGCYLP